MPTSQKIGLTTATVIGINSMIGAGIFTAPAALAYFVGPAGIITYFFVILAVWCMALSFARLAQLYPSEDSFYTYAYQWGGHAAGLFSSGMYIIGVMIAMGLVAQLEGRYLHEYFPSVTANLLGILAVMGIVMLNIVGGSIARAGQFITLCCTVGPIALITLLCFSKASVSNLTPFAPYGLTNIFRAAQMVIFGFFGFESTTTIARDIQNPERNVPRALTYAIMFISLVYFLFILSIMLAIPAATFIDPAMPVTQPLMNLFPDYVWIINIIHFAITSAFLGVLNAMLWATAALFLSLTKRAHSPIIKKLHATEYLTHKTSVLFLGLLIIFAYSAFKNIALFFSLTSIFIITGYITALITLVIDPKARKNSLAQTVIGIGTALLIAGFAIEGTITQILN